MLRLEYEFFFVILFDEEWGVMLAGMTGKSWLVLCIVIFSVRLSLGVVYLIYDPLPQFVQLLQVPICSLLHHFPLLPLLPELLA